MAPKLKILAWLFSGVAAEESCMLSGVALKKAALEMEGPATCPPNDLGCFAQQLACSLAGHMAKDWPVASYLGLLSIHNDLAAVCQTGSLSNTQPNPVPGPDPSKKKHKKKKKHDPEDDDHEDDHDDDEDGKESGLVETSSHSERQMQNETGNLQYTCPDPTECVLDVIQYEQQNAAAGYAATAAKDAAAAAISTLQEVLSAAEMIALPGYVAFIWLGAVLDVFFPSAGGLPSNPCTYATTDWGKCVWEQIKPFVEFFVQQQLDQAFEAFWSAKIQSYQGRLWAMNSSAYHDSTHYPNGSIEKMPSAVQTKMYDTLFQIYQDMIGDIPLFMASYAINTTAGAYLSQFGALHSSIMVNLMGSLKYRDAGDRFNYQTITACYAKNVYSRATASFKARMAALSGQNNGQVKCCNEQASCETCNGVTYKDSWKQCGWTTGFTVSCYQYLGMCDYSPDIYAPLQSPQCYQQHTSYVEQQTVQFWESWLAPIPSWLHSIVLMQKIKVKPSPQPLKAGTGFNCAAF